MKRSLSKVVSTGRSAVLSLPLQKGFPTCALNVINDASRSVNDDSRMMLQIVASLTEDSRGVIYSCNMFIV